MVTLPLILHLGGKDKRISEFKATSLVYKVSSRTARATQRNSILEKKQQGKKEKKKKNLNVEAGEMAQWLRALSALPEVLISIPSNHMVAHTHMQ